MKKERKVLKKILQQDLKIVILVGFATQVVYPYFGTIKGSIGEMGISFFAILSLVILELLPILRRKTTLKSSIYIVAYMDLFMALLVIYLLMINVSNRVFISSMLFCGSIYTLLLSNMNVKFSGWMAQNYPGYWVEEYKSKYRILFARASIAAFITASIWSKLFEANSIMLVFVVATTIEAVYSIYVLRKYWSMIE